MYRVMKNDSPIGEGTLTACLEFIATQMSQFHPEAVTVSGAVDSGYRLNPLGRFQPVYCGYPSYTDLGPRFSSNREAQAWLDRELERNRFGDPNAWGYVIDWQKQLAYEAALKGGAAA
jgi:hypothetical protein